MFALDVLEVAAVFGSITATWFALIGWKLMSLNRSEGRPGIADLQPDE